MCKAAIADDAVESYVKTIAYIHEALFSRLSAVCKVCRHNLILIEIQNLHNSAILGNKVLAETPVSHQNKITICRTVTFPLADEL